MNELITQIRTIDVNDTLSSALSKFDKEEVLIVTKEGKYFGELYPALVLHFKGNSDVAKVDKISKKGATLNEKEADLGNIATKFASGSLRWVSILDRNQKPIGVVRAGSALKYLSSSLAGRKTFEFTDRLLSIDFDTSAEKAEEIMIKNGVEELAVKENNVLVGLVSSRDIAMKIKPYSHKKDHDVKQRNRTDSEKVTVGSIFTPEFELKKVSMYDPVIDSMAKAGFEDAYVFSGPTLQGKLSFQRMLSKVKLEAPSHVEVSGLSSEEAMFKESIFEECQALLSKFSKGGNIHLRIKSSKKGKDKKIYEVHGRLEIDGKSFVRTPREMKDHRENWDIGSAVSEALDELKIMYLKTKR